MWEEREATAVAMTWSRYFEINSMGMLQAETMGCSRHMNFGKEINGVVAWCAYGEEGDNWRCLEVGGSLSLVEVCTLHHHGSSLVS